MRSATPTDNADPPVYQLDTNNTTTTTATIAATAASADATAAAAPAATANATTTATTTTTYEIRDTRYEIRHTPYHGDNGDDNNDRHPNQPQPQQPVTNSVQTKTGAMAVYRTGRLRGLCTHVWSECKPIRPSMIWVGWRVLVVSLLPARGLGKQSGSSWIIRSFHSALQLDFLPFHRAR